MKTEISTRFDERGFIFVLVSSSILRLCDLYECNLISMVLCEWWVVSTPVLSRSSFQYVLLLISLIFPIAQLSFILPIVYWILSGIDQSTLPCLEKLLSSHLLNLEKILRSGVPPVSRPLFGVNSSLTGMLSEARMTLDEWLSQIDVSLSLVKSVEAVKLRGLGLSPSVVDISERPVLDPSSLVSQYEIALRCQKLIVLLGTTFIFGIVFASPIFVLVPIGYYGLCWLEDGSAYVLNTKAERSPISKGVYRITNRYFGLPISHGIGTCYNNVLHVPYHVCSGSDISVAGSVYTPFYVSIEEDLVTYAGPPQFSLPRRDVPLFVNCETDDSRTTYVTNTNVATDESMFAWYSVTRPGESGSPVFIESDDGLLLVGLAGRYFQTSHGDRIEFCIASPMATEHDSIDGYTKLVKHPGSGKTYREIPDIVARFLATRSGKILVSGVSVLVCEELYNSLRSRFSDIGLSIRGKPNLSNPRARIQICAHQTAVALINKKSSHVNGLAHLIIDEAHSDNVGTILLRRIGRHLMSSGVHLTEVSATLDGVFDDTSNYPIQDVRISGMAIRQTIRECLDAGKRVMVFVSSMQSRDANAIRKNFYEYNPVLMSRATFEDSCVQVRDVSRRLIITTDISECGVNVPDLDVVVDTSSKYTFVVEGALVYGKVVTPDHASMVQRRGRVGRFKPGEYYYVHPPRTRGHASANELDADILSTGREWGCLASNSFGITLSEYQFEVWLTNDKPPTWIWLAYDGVGRPRDRFGLSEALRVLTTETPSRPLMRYSGCKDCRECAGGYIWYDARMHSDLCNAKKDVLALKKCMTLA